ncbi:hypothetical protein ALC57_12223 [Trachymyrmex cornetzi]|uniref:Uncharacterized protein n=1 Tax=Trachymyrmex cornetzi TaxID=471704 RepID=A0A151J165_9HYME|nr:hypothetical protein ALC57_12223 [Trachymyrmex cornetzi]
MPLEENYQIVSIDVCVCITSMYTNISNDKSFSFKNNFDKILSSCDLAMISIEKELANSFDYIISLDYVTIEVT